MKFTEFLGEHKIWWQSAAIFTAWLCFVFAILISFLPLFLILIPPISFFKASLAVMLLSFLTTSYLSTKEYREIFISWVFLGFGLLAVCLSVQNGVQMMLLPVSFFLLAFVSYFGFTHKSTLRLKGMIISFILGMAMVTHLSFLSWDFLNNKNTDKTFTNEVNKALEQKANEEPLEFIKSDEGRELALEVYGLSSLTTTDKQLVETVTNNPLPIQQAQNALLLFGNTLVKNPYFVIIDYYFSNLLNTKQK